MIIKKTDIPDVKILIPSIFKDRRGLFQEIFNKMTLESNDIIFDCLQINKSSSIKKNTIRGLHYQIPPFAQAKLVRVSKGSILDIAVDIRKSSPTFGKYVKKIINAANRNQFLVPRGFAHGFLTLEDDTEVEYLVDNFFSKEHDKGLFWKDDELGIDWGISKDIAIVSSKDLQLPNFEEVNLNYNWNG